MMKTLQEQARQLELYAQLAEEWGAKEAPALVKEAQKALEEVLSRIQAAPVDPVRKAEEPDDYGAILAKRPGGTRLRKPLDPASLREKMQGALLCRLAGCTLGAVVENWDVARMEQWAAMHGDAFPPTDYWSAVYIPEEIRYGKSPLKHFAKPNLKGVPADDDIGYTLLGLLIAETYGLHFTVEDVGKAWVDWLPLACTAEEAALQNLKKGIPAAQAAEHDNPYVTWIGADIRSDPWGYIAAGWPEEAARMAYQDAILSHRRGGVYGEMYLAAAQAAAFTAGSAEEALRAGLLEIPAGCALAEDIEWALTTGPKLSDWREGRALVDQRFPKEMSRVHTNNNMCLMIFGLLLGGRDVTRVLSETVAMGLDNDCTAASAGSIVGALVGASGVPTHWTAPFEDTIFTYLTGHERFSIEDVTSRFVALNQKLFGA